MLNNQKQYIHANGKLLLSSEYFVLDGALALALPTSKGQNFSIEAINGTGTIQWKSFDEKDTVWFEGIFSINNFEVISASDVEVADRLNQILNVCFQLNHSFLKNLSGIAIESHLTFPKNWGLGTSSTLIYSIAKWAEVNPFLLLEKTFGGSGYDIACAGAKSNILYSKSNGIAKWEPCEFDPPFKDQLYFIFLEKKQNSREGIAHYRKIVERTTFIAQFTALTKELLITQNLSNFEDLIDQHEDLISNILHLPKVKELHFKDYWGSIKSLGAWGGDFILATSNRSAVDTQAYFNQKGFSTFLKYQDLILR